MLKYGIIRFSIFFFKRCDQLPTISETIKATAQLLNGKAAGVDGIPPEVRKHTGPPMHN